MNTPDNFLLDRLEALIERQNNRQTRRQFVRLFQKMLKQQLKPNVQRHPKLCMMAQEYNKAAAQ